MALWRRNRDPPGCPIATRRIEPAPARAVIASTQFDRKRRFPEHGHQDFHFRRHNDRTATAKMSTCVIPESLAHSNACASSLRPPIPNSDSRLGMALAGMGIGNPSKFRSSLRSDSDRSGCFCSLDVTGTHQRRCSDRTERCRARAAATRSRRIEGHGRRAPPKRFSHSACQTSCQIASSGSRALCIEPLATQ